MCLSLETRPSKDQWRERDTTRMGLSPVLAVFNERVVHAHTQADDQLRTEQSIQTKAHIHTGQWLQKLAR